MASSTPIGYCEHCKQNVLLTRQDIDVCLAIILLIFTAGIGLIIYLLIYYSKPKNRCVHCGTVVTTFVQSESQAPQQLTYTQQPKQEALPVEIIEGEKASYCPLCGAQLDERNQSFCSSCGSKI
ncbi:MAG: zinc-ribbon domain-containing protein [Promethearchaeota archaeon]|nr:MAG: zinc-ribbon domain-containing protein [Candidatus Lokiarchaeota archaeon]